MINPSYCKNLTIAQAQREQPWTVPYSEGVTIAEKGTMGQPTFVPHILGSHCVLHVAKSLGKIAAVYEARDHDDNLCEADEVLRRREIRKMAADLMTAALRFANLEGFDLAEALVERVIEKNGEDFGAVECTSIRSDGS